MTTTAEAMCELVKRYVMELESQFRTLNLFSQHTGEIGRAHEAYLRAVLVRFLPRAMRVATGFVRTANATTTQRDIIVFDDVFQGSLFEVGDIVAVDRSAFVGAIEVKTGLVDKENFWKAWLAVSATKHMLQGFSALFAWEGLTWETAAQELWRGLRDPATPRSAFIDPPDTVLVQGRFCLRRRRDVQPKDPPFKLIRLDENEEGPRKHIGLLMLLNDLRQLGRSADNILGPVPPWLREWARDIDQKAELIDWPDDIRERAIQARSSD